MIRLAWRYLWSSPLTTALNLLLLTLGLAAVTSCCAPASRSRPA